MISRRGFVTGAVALATTATAFASAWPERPVKIIFPYAPGSANDTAARLLAQALTPMVGQAVFVENRVGANGALAAETVARAAGDGHTLFWATTPQIAIQPVMSKVTYDPVKDFAPVTAILLNSWVLVVNAQLPVRSVSEFVDYVRARDDRLVYAEGGVGSIGHLTMALFLKRAGLRMTNVSYKGNSQALNDVVAGHVPVMFSILGDALAQAETGRVRLLAISSLQRSPEAPELPTIAESGFPGFNAVAWNGLLAPVRTPQGIVAAIATASRRALAEKPVQQQLTKLGIQPVGSSPEEFAAMIAADIPLWREAVRSAGLAAS